MADNPYYAANGAAPVVLKGTVVPQEGIPASAYDHVTKAKQEQATGEGVWTKGENQPRRCNDFFFAVLFYAHLGVMGWCTAFYGSQMAAVADDYGNNGGERLLLAVDGDNTDAMEWKWRFSPFLGSLLHNFLQATSSVDVFVSGERVLEGDGDDAVSYSSDDVLLILSITGAVGFVVSALALSFMMRYASGLIKFALWFNIIVSLTMGILGAVAGVLPMALVGFISFLFTAYYAYLVWDRIPFAASNLITAVTAVRANFGLTFFAYFSLLLLGGWILWWTVSFLAYVFVASECDAEGQCEGNANGVVVFLFLISFFWTQQVIKNTVHTTVAGTVGTWWFTPAEASSCCSNGVRDSFVRSITLSFGSICFGSLIVAIIQAMKDFLHQAREADDGVLLCCAECLLGCLESLAEYFNQWAFVYVGLYGYQFIEAGKNVMMLFKSRGWTTIITDNLIDNVLFMVSFGVGLVTGLIAVLISSSKGLVFDAATAGAPFIAGLVIGVSLAHVLMGVVGSAVNTVIVCYAEAPNEFQQNHPELSNEMRGAWRQAWPVEFTY